MDDFLGQLAAATPVPGGGSAACYAAALAVALGEMVVGLGAKKQGIRSPLKASLAAHRRWFKAAAKADAESFLAVLAAYRLAKDDAKRPQAIGDALRGAARSPLSMMARMVRAKSDILASRELCPKSALSDWRAALVLLNAALAVAVENVRVNLDGASQRQDLEESLNNLQRAYGQLSDG
jgi:formiminotetrahydrofolate cyclodeaminase